MRGWVSYCLSEIIEIICGKTSGDCVLGKREASWRIRGRDIPYNLLHVAA